MLTFDLNDDIKSQKRGNAIHISRIIMRTLIIKSRIVSFIELSL
jgi:hypothetical protein